MTVAQLRTKSARPSLKRPQPPEYLCTPYASHTFVPAPDVSEWLRATFINPDSPLFNPEHAHLQGARIAVLWTSVPNARQQRVVVGTCETLPVGGAMGKWPKARAAVQMAGWFGGWWGGADPHFLITFDARFMSQADDATFCAVVEHEMLHAGQEKDEFGAAKFTQAGEPKYALRGHDVETFVGLASRYGAVEANVAALHEALKTKPSIGRASLDWACGSCAKAAA